MTKEGRALLGLVTLPIAFFLNALTFQMLWKWFLVPIGVPALGLGAAAGVSMLIGYSTHHFDQARLTASDEQKLALIVYQVLHPIIALCVGFAIHVVIT